MEIVGFLLLWNRLPQTQQFNTIPFMNSRFLRVEFGPLRALHSWIQDISQAELSSGGSGGESAFEITLVGVIWLHVAIGLRSHFLICHQLRPISASRGPRDPLPHSPPSSKPAMETLSHTKSLPYLKPLLMGRARPVQGLT